eukprot:g56190.t1
MYRPSTQVQQYSITSIIINYCLDCYIFGNNFHIRRTLEILHAHFHKSGNLHSPTTMPSGDPRIDNYYIHEGGACPDCKYAGKEGVLGWVNNALTCEACGHFFLRRCINEDYRPGGPKYVPGPGSPLGS